MDLSLEREFTSDDEETSLIELGSILLRARRMIMTLALGGALLGLALGLLRPRVYASLTTFIPQDSEGNVSGLAAAASQFGIRVPAPGNGGWGPPVYVELLRSNALLEPIALDTVVVAEEGGKRVPVAELLRVKPTERNLRAELAVEGLRRWISAGEVKPLGAVQMTVATRWPSVSLELSKRLLKALNEFNFERRKSQASAERQFVEAQAAEAERALREAEDRLQYFLQTNRAIGAPQLSFERDRLQREVNLRQQVYTSLLQSREEAKIKEVRDTPVITVLEDPKLPVVGQPRKSVQKAIYGGLLGAILGVLLALLSHGLAGAKRAENAEAREFFHLVKEATPRFLRRRR
jgi:uncharacterized protein involved in exopolysaccharide biosynthesis